MTLAESQNPITEENPFLVTCARPWLVARFNAPQRMLSWSLTRPGFEQADTVAWLEVRNADLGPDTCPEQLLKQKQAAAGLEHALPLITSRDIRCHHLAKAHIGDITATCLATVGLSNGDRIGMPRLMDHPPAGTINLLVHVTCPLLDGAMIETLSIATEARTTAIIDLGWHKHDRLITGTGTDCIVVACPGNENGARFAGLHTDIGEAVGTACYQAVRRGALEWHAENADTP